MSRFFIHSKTLNNENIYDTERPERLNDHRHVGHCVHAHVVVYMYLIFVLTGQNISATKDCKFASVRRSLNLAFIRE